ncbi:hypothetical protein HanRHA438_Chr16g0760941 [Helianthus annuus]|nr:hypothetical protein HanIR_Chr16g0814191 [Helianthus annuus]KAJ0821269.1 hypothetical protein HanPSC8_Chr16g0718081 [Helianthus annuus]KAJ0835926.1 hypothetical protein HanRHA438_Chr16g0760941 [Helianthus annuus]
MLHISPFSTFFFHQSFFHLINPPTLTNRISPFSTFSTYKYQPPSAIVFTPFFSPSL